MSQIVKQNPNVPIHPKEYPNQQNSLQHITPPKFLSYSTAYIIPDFKKYQL
ncbi:MAG: hypothetical protein V1688_05170 [bacterium]